MRAHHYVAKYSELIQKNLSEGQDFNEAQYLAIADMARIFMLEVTNIVNQRNAQTNRAILAIIKECNTKWKAIQKSLPIITVTFQDVLETFMPDLYEELRKAPSDVFKELNWKRQ